jgi:concanavalin A-like lectin/glucanase superfamily protein/Ig-like domain-containing protein
MATVSAMVNGSTGTSAIITVQTSLPVITQQPTATETLLVGATLRASVANEGTPPFTYRWYRSTGPTLLSTSTSTSALTVPNLVLGSADNYYCVVSNQSGTATSSNLALAVVTPTTFQSAVLAYSPVGFWPLNESSGTTAYDVIGGNNGIYETGATPGAAAGPANAFFSGNTAANFDGNTGHVDIPGAPLDITNAVTVVAWLQLSGLNGFDGVVGHGDTSWRMTVDGSAIPAGNDGAPPADAYNTAVNVNDGAWHMLAYSYNGFTNQNFNGRLYLDGNLVASNSVFAIPAGNNLDMWIGGSPDYGTTTGKRIIAANMADVAVFAEGFTGAQISALYNGTFVPSPTTLTVTHTGGNTVLNWQEGLLLQSSSPRGPWTTNYSAAPPYTVPTTNSSQFFRLLINPD